VSGSFEWRRWLVSGFYSASSALPFNVQTGRDRNNDTNVNDRPAGVGRNSGRGFVNASLDVRVARRFRIGRASVDASVETFNPTFGQATAAAAARQLQFGLRIGL
jgi:hypothetical protein